MTEELKDMGCAAFQAQLPELIGTGENIADHPHVQNCELCRAFVQDLEAIAQAARQLFPVVEPPDELWLRIQSELKSETPAEAEPEPEPGTGGLVPEV